MWGEIQTASETLDCRVPFSLFFGIIDRFFRGKASNSNPLHRLCTLARKQGAKYIVVESALSRSDVRREIDDLNIQQGGNGAAEAIKLTFINADDPPTPIDQCSASNIIGQLVLINYRAAGQQDFSASYVYEAVFRVSKWTDASGTERELLNNFICRPSKFSIEVDGEVFDLDAIYYAQQNALTNVCAHACIRMSLNSVSHSNAKITSRDINSSLGLTPSPQGLTLNQIRTVINQSGIAEAAIYDCAQLSKSGYLSILNSVVESGSLALLIFSTHQTNMEHVVTVFGHTRNTDEWHPQAVPVYAGHPTAPYYPSSAWTDHFLIHDDNFGPYFSLSSRVLEVDPSVKPRWIIALYDKSPNTNALVFEALAAIGLANFLPTVATYTGGSWFRYIVDKQQSFVIRTLLVSRTDYLSHLSKMKAHDGSILTPTDINLFSKLPNRFWMAEFSLPQLFTGNHSKLGEVLFDADSPANQSTYDRLPLAVRMPDYALLIPPGGQGTMHKIGVTAHSPMFTLNEHTNCW